MHLLFNYSFRDELKHLTRGLKHNAIQDTPFFFVLFFWLKLFCFVFLNSGVFVVWDAAAGGCSESAHKSDVLMLHPLYASKLQK